MSGFDARLAERPQRADVRKARADPLPSAIPMRG